MKLVSSENKEREDKQGYSKKILLDDKELNNPGSLVQMIKIKAGETAESHHHKIQTEIFYLLNENGYWIVNGEEIHPKVGDTLVIEPNDKHTVISSKTQDYIYLAFKINYDKDDLYRD
ncbi:MAG: cupin domain-containing protein [Candidatus Absconditabacterales bacterium]